MTEHRWNARQFAKYVQTNCHLSESSPRLIWVTSDALHRAFDAVRNGALETLRIPLPTEPLVIGLENAVSWTPTTPSANIVSVHPIPDLRREAERQVVSPISFQLVETGHLVRGWMSGEAVERSGDLTSVYGGAIEAASERTLATGNAFPPPALGGDEDMYNREQLGIAAVAVAVVVWALLNEPQAQDDSALTVERAPITVGKKRKRRECDVSLVDVKRSSATRSAPTGRVIEHDHRWEVVGHWKTQRYGKGNALTKRIYRESFVCGPPDKPLIRRPKVSVLR